ncbi:hypothetical protein FOZ61_008673 [Perkinsus olseni]|uniref:Enoyl reductase (ER) domain-containing protein n=1 Tax=Perkinsus olseni TaxID=32597 RepID=A0A7J6LAV8_PEROL|nr:hypothetical protein FOZ61_008673 [Perkinsus olseni]KAF4656322.1 hypothetical protein FOL46_007869 [Perkinsus olseni]
MVTPEENKAMVLRKVDDMSFESRPITTAPAAGECLVRVKACGICGSDVHYLKNGRIGDFIVRSPMVIGHEAAGIVEAVGDGVTNVEVGDKVAMEPGVPCGQCDLCKSGKYNLCPDVRFFATPPVDGCLSNFVIHPARFCFKLPESMTLEEGAMCEPLSVAVYACESKAEVKEGYKVVVFGAGPVGTMTAMVAHGVGASTVVVCDVDKARLEKVKGLCPQVEVLDTSRLGTADEVAHHLKETIGSSADCAIDCSGAQPAVQTAIKVTKSGGVVCLVGMGAPDMTLPILNASVREVDVKGVFRYRNTYPTCIELISSKKVNVMPLITHKYAFTNDDVLQAFEDCRRGVGRDGRSTIKCMIDIQ